MSLGLNHIQVDSQVDKIVMPDNLKVGLMVIEQRKTCASGGCSEEFYGLGFGQSPFHVPPVLSNALAESASKGHYSAAEGILELREAVSSFNKKHFKLDVDPSRIVIGPGTKDIINTLFGIIKGGVILPSPSWIGYRPQIHLLNKHFHTFFLKPENDYKIHPDDFEEFVSKLSGDQHTLVLNNPHNPTGALYSRQELKNFLIKKGVDTSNKLASSLLSCPFHIAVVTGDACMLEPDNFGARIAFVDYDGKSTFDDYINNTPKTPSDEIEFVKRNAPRLVRSTDSLRNWVEYIQSD